MATHTHQRPATSWAQLVHRLLPGDGPEQSRARNAMESVDRRHFVEPGTPETVVYRDMPLSIGYGQTISAPHMHAVAVEVLRSNLRQGARVLDVGSGSGYILAVFGIMVGPNGRVLGVERQEQLAMHSISAIQASNPDLLEAGVVHISVGNVLGEVLEKEGPFDVIHVGAAAASLPDLLVEKLAPGGIMMIPVGSQDGPQELEYIQKHNNGDVTRTPFMEVRYVPLTKPGE